MSNLLNSLSIIFVFFTALYVVYNYGKAQKILNNRVIPERRYYKNYNYIPHPSSTYKDMFEIPSVWMIRGDKDSLEYSNIYRKQEKERIDNVLKIINETKNLTDDKTDVILQDYNIY
jgi:hypothetical protein